jgi:insulysin
VDSEHRKNHQADLWRIFQVNKHLSKPGHVWSKFGSGNRDSLTKAARVLKSNQRPLRENPANQSPIPSRGSSPAPSTASNNSESDADGGFVGRETRRRLLEWWSKEYCASRMRLCIIGKGKIFNGLFLLLKPYVSLQSLWTSYPNLLLLCFLLF